MLKFDARSTTAAAKFTHGDCDRSVVVDETNRLAFNPASSPIRLKCEFNVTVCMNDSNMLSLLLAE